MLKDTDFVIPGLVDQFLVINGTIPENVEPIQFGMKCCIHDNPDRLKNITDEYLQLAGHHYHSWKYFSRMRSKLMGFLKFPSNNFTDLPKSDDARFIICVHIRRTDFLGTGFHMAGESFILNSIKFIVGEEQAKNVSTVFFGDDFEFMEGLANETLTWVNGGIQMKTCISRNSPADDIVYAKHHCDVVVVTSPHSTFGWWMGFLSKGNQVYYNDIRFTDDQSISSGNFNPEDYFPPHWTPIRFQHYDNSTVIESL